MTVSVSKLNVIFIHKLSIILATGEESAAKRRQLDSSSTIYYQQGPKRTTETYRIYSQPTTVTEVTEETRIYQMPTQYEQQQNEITYTIEGTQPKYQPVSFLVSATQEGTRPSITTTTYTEENEQSTLSNPYQIFGTQLRSRPVQRVTSSYGDDTRTTTTTTRYTQQQQQSQDAHLLATIVKPQPSYQQSDSMHTESDASTIHLIRSTQEQDQTTSYITSRPNFTKVCSAIVRILCSLISIFI